MIPAPTTRIMKERWTQLAQQICRPADAGGGRGRLVVLGSGMAFTDFTRDAEAQIQAADRVFHCMYDKVAQAWIGKLRPDALDLKILYGSEIDRYSTYVRMAEALLHFVRRGETVVAVYYGHPGVFAMPAHRAIHVARSEGHEAVMRPGISALDYLVADIGFDPALPGLQSFEATDLLLRYRRIDATLHVVLWQVGVVGEFDFSPTGFENKGFGLLLETLVETYGPDWQVTHYIAPQYVGVEPLIENFTFDQLRQPEIRRRLSSLSTFYIEPRHVLETDPERSEAFGFTRAGQTPPRPNRLYDYKKYGGRERAAIRDFAAFNPPDHYHLTDYTPEVEFMLALSSDLELQKRYRQDPVAAVNDPRFATLSERSRALLAIPHPRAIDAALRHRAIDRRTEANIDSRSCELTP